MKITVKITKEILKASKDCGTFLCRDIATGTNCAVALAVREIFPGAYVYTECIASDHRPKPKWTIELPITAQKYITRFDSLVSSPEKRLDLPTLSFEIDIPDGIHSTHRHSGTRNHSL